MIQTFKEKRKPSFTEKLNAGMSNARQVLEQYQQQAEANRMQQQQRAATGQYLKSLGVEDAENLPLEFQKELVKQYGKYAAKTKALEGLGFSNRSRSLGQTGTSEQDMQDQVNPQTNEIEVGDVGVSSLYPEEDILQISSIDPQRANLMQKFNESIKKEQQEGEKLRQREIEASEKLDYQSFKDNDKYVEKVLGGYEGYKREKAVLDQMEKIANKNEMPTPLLVQALSKIGLPLGLLENPDAEQFEKLSQELMKGIQGTYGNRILQSEVQMFMKSIPTLLNSPEGQKRLIQQWKILNEGKKIYYDAYKDIRKQYPKRLPPDLHEKVLEQADLKLDKFASKFGHLANIPNDYVKTPGKFLVLSPDGTMGEINASELDEAIKAGYEYLE